MHHHHPLTVGASTSAAAAGSGTHAQQRRRKKRPNYGTRTVEVHRGYNGFGFTISGQQPCRLSCIVNNSPADHAGLRAGDFLISVNGLNVSKLPHETVVQLIGNSFGSIRMQIAENYYSDSSDEENAALMLQQQALVGHAGANAYASHLGNLTVGGGARAKPRFLHHKTKMHRLRNSPQKKRITAQLQQVGRLETHLLSSMPAASKPSEVQALRPLMEDLPLSNINHAKPSPSKCQHVAKIPASSSDVANVSAMVRVPTAALEYRAIVGYLGTIEMPKQISHSSKLQTVRSCIRKLRQEKRHPTTVLMTILPDCLRLQSSSGTTLASYASERLNYVSSSSESENRFFGLVTSAVHTSQVDEEEYEDNEMEPKAASSSTGHISISNSCHVFVIDIKLCEHPNHIARANEFRIQCTNDPISNLCLEFPNNSEYVVNLIRSMYTMRILPPATRHSAEDAAPVGAAAAHSPQPSNHSEISTTTSNSDSGIGFHNDCTNISDRILVVDFPGALDLQARPTVAVPRPMGIFNNFSTVMDKRLTVRAMPDPKTPEGPNLLASLNMIKSPASSLTTTRSCDDVLTLVERSPLRSAAVDAYYMAPASMDDISLHSAVTATMDEHLFLRPTHNVAKQNKRKYQNSNDSYMLLQDCYSGGGHSVKADKLSPKVFGLGGSISKSKKIGSLKRHSLNFNAIECVAAGSYTANNSFELDTWSSLQDLPKTLHSETIAERSPCSLEIANSEPDMGNRALPSNVSPFRRAWGHSSFRTPRTDKHARTHDLKHPSPLVRRTASMTASDNDVYIKSMDNGSGYLDEIKRSHQQITGASKTTLTPAHKNVPSPLAKAPASAPKAEKPAEPTGVAAWASSFERLIEDPAGLHTFAEFLKKEFSAENIYFWTACERFRHLESETERAQQARAIFDKHLASSALEPVNVDSQARNLTEEKLQSADRDIFAHAQKQIFNLMKFDSYQRFIRSDLYKSCLEAEEKHHALPFTGEDLDELLKTNFHKTLASKLKKSASNAEDRRRKSLLPWHRKTRSKSRDRAEGSETGKSKLPQLSGSSLKITSSTQNSMSDIHSSRSSLSSFDALPAAITNFAPNGQAAESSCTLCRVILSDGATTIVQTRPEETVGQLVERLLEKRGLTYQFYDVVANGSSKSIDLQHSSQLLAGKEVMIEQRVAFKLDLPDPKVISVKSKPKKQLHEVIRPILHKYNYTMEAVQVLMRDTHAPLDLSLPVTVADGQRLQVVLVKPPALAGDYQNGCAVKFAKPALPKSVTFPNSAKAMAVVAGLRTGSAAFVGTTPQSTLDEITNKVFTELMQGKVEAHAGEKQPAKDRDLCSLKSEDCSSETSSLFERMRRRDPNIPGFKLKSKKKSTSSQHSEEPTPNSSSTTGVATTATADPNTKKPIIAKLKAGVKLQVTERVAEKQDELLEGLKRAQLARLEDQRGTEINFELPDFLKNKENLSVAASKLRKVRANLSPINKTATPTIEEVPSPPVSERPQPAPRLSITNRNKSATTSPMKIDDEMTLDGANTSNSSFESDYVGKGPPPLPPKPKVLPIKPSNWGVTASPSTKSSPLTSFPAEALVLAAALPSKIPIDINRKAHLPAEPATRCAYLEEPSSSFV